VKDGSMNSWILKADKLDKHFFLHEQGRRIPSTFEVDLELSPGQLLAITGPSGAGKSSLLKCIWRTYLPTGGHLWLREASGSVTDLAKASEQHMLALRRTELGSVTQFLHCLPRKSALDVVAQPLVDGGVPAELARAKAAHLLTRLNVPEHLWAVAPATFSGGEQQRINLARGLIRPVRLLLLDEPTASLDPVSRECAIALLHELKAGGTAMLAIFHDPALVNALADGEVRVLPHPSLCCGTAAADESTRQAA
jgi:alpha-D-ribose 1-methylphosphonate 5-triphosphate synthase subunit PhnL